MRHDYAVFAPGGLWQRTNTAREALALQRAAGGVIYRKQADHGAWDAPTFIASSERWGTDLATFDVEYTDTFGGEANYSWVQRWQVHLPENASDTAIMRAAKAAAGLTGVKGRTDNFGDMRRFRPHGSCTVLFVTFHDA